ncbi:MAG: alanine racemase [Ignavibacteriae bacterium]|nr:alanine racemase [Ignavibacteriota bacterium]
MSEKKKYERPVVTKLQSGIMNKFGSGPAVSVLESIDGVPIKDLHAKYGSPLFVLSENTIRSNQRNAYRIFKNRYPKVQFAWSYKTNYLNAVCSVFHQEGSWAEVVSEFEYDKERKLGIPAEQILFNGPDKSAAALTKAISEGAKIHIDHFDELYSITGICERSQLKAHVAIRVNMDVGVYPQWDRFGLNYENGEAWQALKRIAANKRLRLVGLHTHIGTYMMTAEAYRIAATKLATLAKSLRDEFDVTLDYIDVGGGFASHNTLIGQYLPAEEVVPSMEQYADAIASGLKQGSFKHDEMPMLILETGRALIDDAGFLISKVIANKRLSTGRRAIIVDAGVNLMFTSFWYKHKISPAQPISAHAEDAVIYGPLCMNIDVIRDGILLPTLNPGDSLVLHRVGAYNMTQWMQFITLRPNVVMVMSDGTVELIRKAETLESVSENEVLPEQLRAKRT